MSSTDPPRKPGRRARLGREQVLRAAFELADERGLDAATMRAVADRLDAEAMSLYRHVRNKDDLLDGLVDLVFAEAEVPQREDWKESMRQRSHSLRAALRRHPWALALMESRMQPGPQNLAHHDAVLEVLLGTGFSAAEATHAYNLFDSYIYGFALQEQGLPFTTAEELAEMGPALIEQISPDLYPHMRAVSAELLASHFDYGAEFDFGLDLILDGIERFRVSRTAPGS